jgi:hypothetical protein
MKLAAAKRLSLAILAVAVVSVLSGKRSRRRVVEDLQLERQARTAVETSDANIKVTTWDQNTIEAKVITERYKIGEGGIRIEEHQNGDAVEIDVRYPHHEFTVEWGNHRVDIIIQMPREGKVHLKPATARSTSTDSKVRWSCTAATVRKPRSRRRQAARHRPATGTSPPTGASMLSNSRPATATSKCAPGRIHAGRGLAARDRRRQRFARNPRRTRGGRRSAHQRRPHRSRYADHHRRQNSRRRNSRQTQRRRQRPENQHRRRIDSFAQGLRVSVRHLCYNV